MAITRGARLFNWVRNLFRRRKRDLRLMLHIRYKNNAERHERVVLAPQFYQRLLDSLISNMEIREARVYSQLFHHHKSFADDWPVDERFIAALAASEPATEA